MFSNAPEYMIVYFEFFQANKECSVSSGRVLVRQDEMVLEVECPDDRPYNIRGIKMGQLFRGHHEGQPGDIPVDAKWILLDDTYVGIWIEDGKEWLFRFKLATPES